MDNKTKEEIVSISKLRTPKDHLEKVKALVNARWEHEKEWKLNHSFYQGKQYVFYPKRSANMVTLATEPAELPRYRVRLVSNQIMPGVRSLVAKLTKTKPVIHAVPSVATERAARGAQMAERLHEDWWRSLNLNAKRNEAWTWAQLGGQGWWRIGWDFNAGKTMTYVIAPNGQPIISDKIADLFRDQMSSQGLQAIEATVSLGEVRVDVLSPCDVILDPSPSDYTECQYAYCVYRLDPDEVYKRWKVWLQPDTSGTDFSQHYSSKEEGLSKDLVTVYVGDFRKNSIMPKGKYVVFSANHEQFLYSGDWPYPFDEIPLVKFPGVQIPGCVYDRAVVSDARPLQQEFNKAISQIIEYKNLNISPQFIAPANSMMRNRITGEPGAIWYYNPTSVGGGAKPEPIQLGALPPYVFENLNFIIQRIREIFQMTDVSQGSLPPNLEAGVAIDLLQEVAIDQLEPQIQQGEAALARAGTLMLGFAQTYYDEPRLAKIYGNSESQAKAFSKSDIKGVDIYVEAGSGIPRTRAGRQMRIKQMIDTNLIRPDQAWKYYDMADMKTLASKFSLDEDKAFRENDYLLRKIPLNKIAVENAITAVQSGFNPITQMQIKDKAEAQSILLDASLEPGPADNHYVEMDIHSLAIKSEEFDSYPPEIQRAHYIHYQKHAEMASQLGVEKPPPKVTYQIKGTAGPSASTAILQTAGVNVTPEQMSEPPLETWVSDSMDKPDMDETSNDPFSQLDMMLMLGKIQEQQAKASLMEKRAQTAKTLINNNES